MPSLGCSCPHVSEVCEVLLLVQRKHASPAFEKIESFLHFMSDVGQTVPKRESVALVGRRLS